MKNKPRVLYHYTSMSSLFQLLENIKHTLPEDAKENSIDNYSLEFRASNISYVNDPTEREFYFNGIVEALYKYEKKKNLRMDSSQVFFRDVQIFQNVFGDDYTISFSENADSLTMWRGYGANGCGVAIGFDREKLETMDSGKLARVEYMDKKKLVSFFSDEFLLEIHNEIIAETKRNLLPSPKMIKRVKGDMEFVKDRSYADEKEWKLLIQAPDIDTDFYEKNGLIIPYYKIKIPLSAIDTIIIGPCANSELSLKSLQMMMYKKLIGIPRVDLSQWIIKIAKSKVPYINL